MKLYKVFNTPAIVAKKSEDFGITKKNRCGYIVGQEYEGLGDGRHNGCYHSVQFNNPVTYVGFINAESLCEQWEDALLFRVNEKDMVYDSRCTKDDCVYLLFPVIDETEIAFVRLNINKNYTIATPYKEGGAE